MPAATKSIVRRPDSPNDVTRAWRARLAAVSEHEHDHEHDEEPKGQLAPHDEDESLEREARRLLALSRIRQYGDPALRMKAREVESFDDDLPRLVERMTDLM